MSIGRRCGAIAISLLPALLLAACSPKSAAAPQPPRFAAKAVCRPQFHVGSDMLVAGTGFVLDLHTLGARPLLVSAMHLFGPDGGLETAIPWNELPARVTAVDCQSFSDKSMLEAGAALAIPGAKAFAPHTPFRDISAFPLVSVPTVMLRLAGKPARPGDSVWIASQLIEGAPPTQLLHHATVDFVAPDHLEYRFDNPKLKIQATSGAPVLNDAGEVVGINLAGGVVGGAMYGEGDSLDVIRSALTQATPH